MKIDLHCHTKKTKSGDPASRNVTKEKFVEVLSNNAVSIAAITNHNYFSLDDYISFEEYASKRGIQVWPGIELDVNIKGESGHMLLIGNPTEVTRFNNKINGIIGSIDPNKFQIDYKLLSETISDLDVVIIAHWALEKESGFSDKAIFIFKNELNNSSPVLLEPSKLKSVGIMEAHGYEAFIGSDVKDWNNYPSSKIPSLKMSIKDFRTFKLLLKKDKNAIDSYINQKQKREITIQPFLDENDSTKITLPIFNDINIIFGGKATGKSKIVEAIKDFYTKEGKGSSLVYYKATDNLEKYNEIIKKDINEDMFGVFGVSDCQKEIESIKAFKIDDVTSTSSFYKGIKSRDTKGKINKFGFFKASYSYIDSLKDYEESATDLAKIKDAIAKIINERTKLYISNDKYNQLNSLLEELKNAAFFKAKSSWITNKSQYLTEWTIKVMKNIGKIKSGLQAMPINTGLCDFYSSLKRLNDDSKTIYNSMSIPHKKDHELIGNLPDKFDVYVYMEYYMNPKERPSSLDTNIKIQYQKGKPKRTDISKAFDSLQKLVENPFDSGCTANVAAFIKTFEKINSLKDCFGFRSFVVKKEKEIYSIYSPSDGEKSMLQISHAFSNSDKEIFILDEPELSVGHNYINKNIVPKLKELSKLDKTIIVSTHDANIAVRTLPINTIYREYKKTFVGNLFIDKLVCLETGEECEWTQKSLEYLEGGRDAFNERGDSYGIQSIFNEE